MKHFMTFPFGKFCSSIALGLLTYHTSSAQYDGAIDESFGNGGCA